MLPLDVYIICYVTAKIKSPILNYLTSTSSAKVEIQANFLYQLILFHLVASTPAARFRVKNG